MPVAVVLMALTLFFSGSAHAMKWPACLEKMVPEWARRAPAPSTKPLEVVSSDLYWHHPDLFDYAGFSLFNWELVPSLPFDGALSSGNPDTRERSSWVGRREMRSADLSLIPEILPESNFMLWYRAPDRIGDDSVSHAFDVIADEYYSRSDREMSLSLSLRTRNEEGNYIGATNKWPKNPETIAVTDLLLLDMVDNFNGRRPSPGGYLNRDEAVAWLKKHFPAFADIGLSSIHLKASGSPATAFHFREDGVLHPRTLHFLDFRGAAFAVGQLFGHVSYYPNGNVGVKITLRDRQSGKNAITRLGEQLDSLTGGAPIKIYAFYRAREYPDSFLRVEGLRPGDPASAEFLRAMVRDLHLE